MALPAIAYSILYHPLLNVLLFFVGLGLVEEHTLPDSMKAGDSAIASWTIDKGQTEGFARLQLSFPRGLAIEPLNTDGASFSFEDKKAKFIWMDIPSSPSIHVSVKITALQNFSGGDVLQWFSFVENGSRQDVEFEPHVISLDQSSNSAIASIDSWHPQANRSFARDNSDFGRMAIEVSGFEPGSFLKWTEIIPEDCVFEWELNGDPSIQDHFGDTLTLVWQEAPSIPTLHLSYRLSGDLDDCVKSIHGTVNTLLNNKPHRIELPSIQEIQESSSLQADHSTESKERMQVEPELEISPAPRFTVPEPDEHLAYRVQIMACHRDVDQEWFEDQHQFSGQVDTERHDHWIKYTTGSHSNYRQARNARVRLTQAHQFSGPFVTAYLRNERITVQEALLLSNQNWTP